MPTTTFIWDEQNCLAETDGSDVIDVVYTNEPRQYGNLVSSRLSSTTYYHHFDAIGSTRHLSTLTGAESHTFLFDAWGKILFQNAVPPTAFLWIGQRGYYYDAEIGRYHVRARSYIPSLGQWSSIDPWWTVVAEGKYIYVMNMPVLRIDPSGRCHVCKSVAYYTNEQTVKGLDDMLAEGTTPFADMAKHARTQVNGTNAKSKIKFSESDFGAPGLKKAGNPKFTDKDEDGNEFTVPKDTLIAGHHLFFNAFWVCDVPKCGLHVKETLTSNITGGKPTVRKVDIDKKKGDSWTDSPLKKKEYEVAGDLVCDTLIIWVDAPGGVAQTKPIAGDPAFGIEVKIAQVVTITNTGTGKPASGVGPLSNDLKVTVTKGGEVK